MEALVAELPAGARVFDPFSGTGTTALVAAAGGREGIGLDLNPFLVWLGNAKLRRYGPRVRARVRRLAARIAADAGGRPAPPPPLANLPRWWAAETLLGLRGLRAALDRAAPRRGPSRDLLLLAFCRAALATSNAAFDHVSLSFRERSGAPDPRAPFREAVEALVSDAAEPVAGRGRIDRGDARRLHGVPLVDAVVTSPPYANRVSYIRELRPYMAWTGHLRTARDAGELDWAAIGGTWGVATSRLATWRRDPAVRSPPGLAPVLRGIAGSDAKHAPLLAAYVARYVEDVARHVDALPRCLRPGATVCYVVGNSKFYEVVVPTEAYYAELLAARGFRGVGVERLRKRNSKKELYEYAVRARWAP